MVLLRAPAPDCLEQREAVLDAAKTRYATEADIAQKRLGIDFTPSKSIEDISDFPGGPLRGCTGLLDLLGLFHRAALETALTPRTRYLGLGLTGAR